MSKRIITISREFGSGGRFLGKQIAKELGIAYYDKEIIAEVATKTGLAKEFVEEKGEYSPMKNLFGYGFIGRNLNGQSMEDILDSVQRSIIIEAAEKGPCVIIGRNADYILKDRNDVLNVFITGNENEKRKRICKLYEKTEKEAEKLLQDIDKRRSIHYKFYTEQTWGMASNYTITLNSSVLGYEKCISLLKELYQE
ncbi:MAG: cytidylate kinase-like family protein [Lachnospiraceae bacterium]|nr:cytidylate kinase-like family protein [Lachnospiraceae bacterium]